MAERKTRVIASSGNVFADLDLPHGEEDMLRVQIALAIAATIAKRKLTQVEAARIVGTDQARISSIIRGRLDGLATDRLLRFLTALGRDVEIRIPARLATGSGRLKVVAAAL